jgi:hypothetical protein
LFVVTLANYFLSFGQEELLARGKIWAKNHISSVRSGLQLRSSYGPRPEELGLPQQNRTGARYKSERVVLGDWESCYAHKYARYDIPEAQGLRFWQRNTTLTACTALVRIKSPFRLETLVMQQTLA